MVGGGDHLAGLHAEGVVGLAALHGGQAEAAAEFQPLYPGDGKQQGRQLAFHAGEEGFPQAGGQAGDGGLQDAPHAVPRLAGPEDLPLHGFPRLGGQGGKGAGGKGRELAFAGGLAQGKGRGVLDRAHLLEPGAHPHPFPFQELKQDAARRHDGGGEPAAEMAAAPGVVIALVFDPARIVPMAGPGGVPKAPIVLAVDILVGDQQAQGRAGGAALVCPAQDLGQIRLPPAGGKGGCALAPLQLPGHEIQVDLQPRGQPLDHAAHGGAVAFPKQGQRQALAHGIPVHPIPSPMMAGRAERGVRSSRYWPRAGTRTRVT